MIVKLKCKYCGFEFELQVATMPPFLRWQYCSKCQTSGKFDVLEEVKEDGKK